MPRSCSSPSGVLMLSGWMVATPQVAAIDPMELFPRLAELTAGLPRSPSPSSDLEKVDVEALVEGLASLGFPRRAARHHLDRALADLRARAATEADPNAVDEASLLREALRGVRSVPDFAGSDAATGRLL